MVVQRALGLYRDARRYGLLNARAQWLAIGAALLVATPAASARGGGRPFATRRFESSEAWNRHRRGGADGARRSSVVALRLLRGGRLQLKDSGKARESHLDRRLGYKEERTDWAMTWTGTWKRVRGRLLLKLRRTARTCQRVEAWRGYKARKLPCPAAAARSALSCSVATVTLHAPSGASKHVKAWRCLPAGSGARPTGTSTPWLFGVKRCVKRVSSRPFRLAPCGSP